MIRLNFEKCQGMGTNTLEQIIEKGLNEEFQRLFFSQLSLYELQVNDKATFTAWGKSFPNISYRVKLDNLSTLMEAGDIMLQEFKTLIGKNGVSLRKGFTITVDDFSHSYYLTIRFAIIAEG